MSEFVLVHAGTHNPFTRGELAVFIRCDCRGQAVLPLDAESAACHGCGATWIFKNPPTISIKVSLERHGPVDSIDLELRK